MTMPRWPTAAEWSMIVAFVPEAIINTDVNGTAPGRPGPALHPGSKEGVPAVNDGKRQSYIARMADRRL